MAKGPAVPDDDTAEEISNNTDGETIESNQQDPKQDTSNLALAPAPTSGEALPTSEEKTWASIAHVSIFLNLVTGFLGPLLAIIIYLIYKDKSRYIAYQSMQAFIFQLIFWVGAGFVAGILWAISVLLMIVIVGCCLMPIALIASLIPLGALVYGVIAAIETSQGKDFKYWLVGDWVRGILD